MISSNNKQVHKTNANTRKLQKMTNRPLKINKTPDI